MTGMTQVADTVRRYYNLVDERRFDELVTLFAKDAVYRRPGYDPLVGRQGLAEFYGGERVIVEGRHTVSELLVDGGKAAVSGTFEGVVKGGDRVRLRFADFFVVDRDGLLAQRETFFFAPMV
jgi:steroid Delta-isomerase